MRIIAGSWRGRSLLSPQDRAIRPTGERAREALFGILEHGRRRCAARASSICSAGAARSAWRRPRAAPPRSCWSNGIAAALALARANLARLGAPPNVSLLAADAARLGPARHAYDLAFLDPPYRSGLATPALAGLLDGWLAPAARIIVELAAKDALEVPEGYALEQERRYGAARFVFLRTG